MLNTQSIFNRIWRTLRLQGTPCWKNNMCAYRGTYNKKCAIGAVIPDIIYAEWMEGKDYQGLITAIGRAGTKKAQRWALNMEKYNIQHPTTGKSLWVACQLAHDFISRAAFAHDLEFAMQKVARDFNLKVLPPPP